MFCVNYTSFFVGRYCFITTGKVINFDKIDLFSNLLLGDFYELYLIQTFLERPRIKKSKIHFVKNDRVLE